ncbi:dehydration-responsive element-binding protein 1E-like [Cannabis sativa]|uniref:dehydration-responsive element-binding protein 1E-like n=1 Tax=Cannabis sativa TaxID=3483 RepID=UPI0029CA783F|nr:dehydration-responsive element-binding protein 1E-like [Cannabis sativa]
MDTYHYVVESSNSEGYKQPENSLSPLSSDEASRRASLSDEEVILASSRPKKRAGRRIFKETRHPVYRGVRRRNNDKWVCELREPNKKTRIWLGTYPTAEMAARAHDVAAIALRGKSACLNFADSAWRLPRPVSLDAKDIRAAATEGAESFRPVEYGGVSMEMKQMESVDESHGGGEEEKNGERAFYVDEDATLDMPGFFADLAEGLLLPPPSNYFSADDVERFEDDVSLWNYSF